jgi:broad specificity phosphatase PhoE
MGVQPKFTSGPQRLTLVRHGHSVGNLADDQAREAGAERLDLDARDADVELSDTGNEQADGVAKWLEREQALRDTSVVISSPYRRAAETARRAVSDLGITVRLDERLRERDLGAFDGLTGLGIRSQHPDEAERRKKLGKFYYQPPMGESWCDVVLRVRSLLDDLRHGYDDADVWLFTHQAVIMSFRYALEDLDEEALLEIDRTTPIPNASMTSYERKGDVLELDRFADTSAVEGIGADVTREPPQAGRGSDEHE